MDFNERVIPGISVDFLYQEALARYEWALKHVKKGVKILDAGCGTGYGSNLLASKGRVIGIDSNNEAIRFAKKNYKDKVNFLLSDITKLQFQNEEFDCICLFEVIEHLTNPRKFLSEMKRVLRKEGLFILSSPNKSIHSPQGKSLSPYHIKEYTYNDFSYLLNSFFKVVKIQGQVKSNKAKKAIAKFMNSQRLREKFAQKDKIGIRKLLPKQLKERIWKYVGGFFGRKEQERLSTKDFPIQSSDINYSDYFVALCQK